MLLADFFSPVAASYASCRPAYPEELFDYLAGLVQRRTLAWDCAAGTGQASIPLASRFDSVIATDISTSMLEQAPRHPRVDYRALPSEASGLPSASVDLVTVAQALHWLDLKAFYGEAARVLRPGGVLAVWTYASPQLDDATLQQQLTRFYRDIVGRYWPSDRRHVEEGYRTLPFPFAERDPPPFDMEESWTLRQLLGYVGTWSATQRYREQVKRDPVPDLERSLATEWGTSVRRVRWPLTVRLGRKPAVAA